MIKFESEKDRVRRMQMQTFVTPNSEVKRVWYKKAIAYGDYMDVYTLMNYKITFKHRRKSYTKFMKTERRKDAIYRARQMIYRLAEGNNQRHGNFKTIFYTLTFADNKTDLHKANQDFKYFIKKLNDYLNDKGYEKIKYLCVPEFQKRGAVHYHGVFFNLPKMNVKDFEKLWGHGYTRIELPKHVMNISAYIAKYLTKDSFDARLYGEKTFFTSRGLLRPQETFDDVWIDNRIKKGDLKKVESLPTKSGHFDKYKKTGKVTNNKS